MFCFAFPNCLSNRHVISAHVRHLSFGVRGSPRNVSHALGLAAAKSKSSISCAHCAVRAPQRNRAQLIPTVGHPGQLRPKPRSRSELSRKSPESLVFGGV